ncbi:TerB family tellurite resistance protein [Accumulibacter sp.]|uniref:TerB family tellurite resistance protein n=1 Tax=Accumulibacter sp. TaxID=2053492 RepID=UPI0025D9A237|nr:TerB family tellurite resistance protein [Accumulibacter sp.]
MSQQQKAAVAGTAVVRFGTLFWPEGSLACSEKTLITVPTRRKEMRNYPVDSKEAMARIVALALLADGALDHSEVAALEKHELRENLGLSAETLERVIHEFCNDMMQTARAPNIGQIELDVQLVDHLLDDIQSPELQKKALTAIVDIVNADGSLNPGEAILISQAMSRWGLELQRVTHIEVREAQHLSPIVPAQPQVADA